MCSSLPCSSTSSAELHGTPGWRAHLSTPLSPLGATSAMQNAVIATAIPPASVNAPTSSVSLLTIANHSAATAFRTAATSVALAVSSAVAGAIQTICDRRVAASGPISTSFTVIEGIGVNM